MDVLEQAHSWIARGHFTANTTVRKVLLARLFMDVAKFVKDCDESQQTLVS